MVLGFIHKGEDLAEKRGRHPELAPLRAKLGNLEQDAYASTGTVRDARSAARAEVSRVQHLLRSNPLREWKGKEDRLRSVIPLFRGENARLRGMDPASIAAFRNRYELDFPAINEQEEFRRP